MQQQEYQQQEKVWCSDSEMKTPSFMKTLTFMKIP